MYEELRELMNLPTEEAVERIKEMSNRRPPRFRLFLDILLTNETRSGAWYRPLRPVDPVVYTVALEALDAAVRNTPALRASHRAIKLGYQWQSKELSDLLSEHPNAFGLQVICSFDSNGYVREQALRNLVEMSGALPFLILRSVDWVPVVAGLAARHARIRIKTEENYELFAAMSAFIYIETMPWSPINGVTLTYRSEILRRPGALAAKRSKLNVKESVYLLSRKLLAKDEVWEEVLLGYLRRKEPRIVSVATQEILKLPLGTQASMLNAVLRSRARPAREVAMELADRFDKPDVLNIGLFDKSWRVRNAARFHLEKRGFKNFAERYMARSPDPAAISGFGETAPDSELSLLMPLIDHESPAVQKEAIRVLGVRKFYDADLKIARKFEGSSGGSVATVVHALRSLRWKLTPDQLRSKLSDSNLTSAQRKAVIGAFDLLPRWDQLPFLLKVVRDESALADQKGRIETWLSQKASDLAGPSPSQLNECFAALEPIKPALGEKLCERLERELDHWWKRLATL